MKEIHPTLLKKLAETKDKYEKVTAFAEMLPLFAKEIVYQELTGQGFAQLAQIYKQTPFSWGVNWYTNRPTNFPEDQPCDLGVVQVYINCCSLFHKDLYSFASKELHEAMKDIPCYFADHLNSTYYFKPNEVEVGLEALNAWYLKVKETGQQQLNEQKRKRLLKELEQLGG
jgi:hypothetical protein